jgi:hypothetical protein
VGVCGWALIIRKGKKVMDEKKSPNQNPAPERLAALRVLPKEIVQSLSKEELHAFLYKDTWPDSLGEKLKKYVVDENREEVSVKR